MVPNLLFVLPSCLPHPPLIHHQWPLASAAFFATTDILHINLFKQANNCSSWANLAVRFIQGINVLQQIDLWRICC